LVHDYGVNEGAVTFFLHGFNLDGSTCLEEKFAFGIEKTGVSPQICPFSSGWNANTHIDVLTQGRPRVEG
jgi:hypothetical protein